MGCNKVGICVLLAMTCAGCASPQAPRDRASSDAWRLQNIEARFLEFQEAQKRQDAQVDSQLAGIHERLTGMERQFGQAAKDAESARAENAALKESLRVRDTQTAQNGSAGDASIEIPAAPPAETPSPVAASEAKIAADEEAPMPPASAVARGDSIAGEYERAVAFVRAGDVEKGRKALDEFIGDYPSHALVPNALYWLGETYYHEKRYAQAILTFKEVVRRFPEHDKAAAALLKVGYSYAQLGDTSNARFYLQSLVEAYPSSEPATLARQRLASL